MERADVIHMMVERVDAPIPISEWIDVMVTALIVVTVGNDKESIGNEAFAGAMLRTRRDRDT